MDKELIATEEGHKYRTCTIKNVRGKECIEKEEMTIPMLMPRSTADNDGTKEVKISDTITGLLC